MQSLFVAITLSLLAASTAATIGMLASMTSDTWRRRQIGVTPGTLQQVPMWIAVISLLAAQLAAMAVLGGRGGQPAAVLAVGSLVGAAVAGIFAVVLSALAGDEKPAAPERGQDATTLVANAAGKPAAATRAPDVQAGPTLVERCERRCVAAESAAQAATEQLSALDNRWFLLETRRDELHRAYDYTARRVQIDEQRAEVEERLGALADVFRETYRAWVQLNDLARFATLCQVTATLLSDERRAHHDRDPERYLEHATSQAATMNRLAEYATAEDEHTQRGLAIVLGGPLAQRHARSVLGKFYPKWMLRRVDAMIEHSTVLDPRRDAWMDLATLLRTTATSLDTLLQSRGPSDRALYLAQRSALRAAIDAETPLPRVPVPPSASRWEQAGDADPTGSTTRPGNAPAPVTRTPKGSTAQWSSTRDESNTLDDVLGKIRPARPSRGAVVPTRVVERGTTDAPLAAPPPTPPNKTIVPSTLSTDDGVGFDASDFLDALHPDETPTVVDDDRPDEPPVARDTPPPPPRPGPSAAAAPRGAAASTAAARRAPAASPARAAAPTAPSPAAGQPPAPRGDPTPPSAPPPAAPRKEPAAPSAPLAEAPPSRHAATTEQPPTPSGPAPEPARAAPSEQPPPAPPAPTDAPQPTPPTLRTDEDSAEREPDGGAPTTDPHRPAPPRRRSLLGRRG